MPNENENNANDFSDLFNTTEESPSDFSGASSEGGSVELDDFDLFNDETSSEASATPAADPFGASLTESNAFDPFPGAPPLDDELAGVASGTDVEEDAKGKKGKKAKKEKVKKEKVKKEKVKKEKTPKAPKAPKAPKEKGSYFGSPTPIVLLIALIGVALAIANWLAFSAAGSDAFMFLIVFDALGVIMLLIPFMLLSTLRKRELSIYDTFLASAAIFSIASVMIIFSYQAKTYGASSKVALNAPSATALSELDATLDC